MFFCRDTDCSETVPLDEDNMFACFVTYIEIYNNSVFDLLDPTEEAITRKYVPNLIKTAVEIGTVSQFLCT